MRPIDSADRQRVVPTATFDSLDASRQPARLIKIDVEGAEQLVVEGMTNFLHHYRPHLILEVTDAFLQHFGHSSKSLLLTLKSLGYQVHEITERGLNPVSDDPSAWPKQFNAYFSTNDSASLKEIRDA